MKYLQLFKVKIDKNQIEYLEKCAWLFNDENDVQIKIENIDANYIVTVACSSNDILKETEIHFIIFDFAQLLKDVVLIY